jgi:hypothetical protein
MAEDVKELWELSDFLRVATEIVAKDPKLQNEFVFDRKGKKYEIDDISRRSAHIELTVDETCTMRCGPQHAYVTGKDGLSAIYELYAGNLSQIPMLSPEQFKYFKDATYSNVMSAFDLFNKEMKNQDKTAGLKKILEKSWPKPKSTPDITSNWKPTVIPVGKPDITCFPALFIRFRGMFNGNASETWKRVAYETFPWDPSYALQVARAAWDKMAILSDEDRKKEFHSLIMCALKAEKFDTDETKHELEVLDKLYSQTMGKQPGSSSVSGISQEDVKKANDNLEALKKVAFGGSVLIKALNDAGDDKTKKMKAFGVFASTGANKPELLKMRADDLEAFLSNINTV